MGDRTCRGACRGCECRSRVDEVVHDSFVLWTRSTVVESKMRAFPTHPDDPRLKIATSETLAALLELLSPIEGAAIMAVPLNPDGSYDPLDAAPANLTAKQASSEWLPKLLNGRNLRAFAQPIVEAATGQVVAFEALMRGQLGDRTVAAEEIIEAARAHSALFQFDQQAREAAIRQIAPQILNEEKLFINFMPTVIYDPEVCLQTTWKTAAECGVSLRNLVFEVVETEQFPSIEHLTRILNTYREHGAKVALDDLGSGHAALAFIEQLRPDIVKLDRELLPKDRRGSLALLQGIVDFSHDKGIEVLAEGIETELQYDIVRELGVEYAQGWLFGRPSEHLDRSGFHYLQAA